MRFPGVLPAYAQLLRAAMLYVAINKLEPNPRDAAGLKILIIGLAGAGDPRSLDAIKIGRAHV